ncbi:MAG: proline--tRNA ligase [Candidatus Pacebacteria bacterium CG_4_10_14_0_8_um_filter_42_14]|nr:MAG: proline--tRNA ligase [Candidatus Pacebacteria bacterium CG_4_10_14_0_8_um_filter_42_14]
MKYSKLLGKTAKNDSKGSKFASQRYLTRGGFIKESTAGRYSFLPLGWRVHEKIKAIVKDEMDKTGAQEMLVPTLHPLEFWEETNRTNSVGFELMTVKDRREAFFALGGTAEEMFVDVVRNLHLSYRDLPFTIYQFSNKFRDELRARGGLLRLREFVMKDGYSFHTDKEDFENEYQVMSDAYARMYKRIGLDALKVAADNGYIGGEYCHEFQVECDLGEGRFFVSEDGSYCAHEDIATFTRDNKNLDEPLQKYQVVDAVRGTTMEDGVKFHNLPLWRQIKDVLYATETGKLVLAITRGDLDINEIKLAHVVSALSLRPASVEEVKSLGSEPGFISPVGLAGKVTIVADPSLRTTVNAFGGANALNKDAININIDRDYTADIEADIAMAQDGFLSENGKSLLIEKKGIEVGNIFQLGLHYSTKMKDANFADSAGGQTPYYMGCYGFGLARTLATVVEKHHDDKGIIWPASIAPFAVHLVSLPGAEDFATSLYEELLKADIEVLWDDRSVSAGVKFADADLIGIPIRLVVSSRNGEKVEWKNRADSKSTLMNREDVLKKLLITE